MSTVEIVSLPEPGLGNQSYLIATGDGGAVVIDPARDPSRYLEAARARGWRIRWTVETHLHADFVSGSRELATYGAKVVLPAGSGVGFPADELDDGDERTVGGLTLEALATPGHTPEHLTYLLRDGDRVVAVFSGGTLTAGGMARPDLISPELTEPLARAAWHSITERLLELPGETPLYPTHGAGSFCSAGPPGEHTSTIGEQREHNPLLQAGDEDAFVERLLSGLGSYPGYFLRLRPVNAAGPAVHGPQPPLPPRLDPEQVRQHAANGAELVDVRPMEAFAAGHVPGSLANPLRDQFGVWLGWLVDLDRDIVLVTSGESGELDRATRECLKIGHEHLTGHIPFPAWREAGQPERSLSLLDPASAAGSGRHVVDVRQAAEWAGGHVPGAVHVELAELAGHPDVVGGSPAVTQCGHGERAMTAASLLARAGHEDVAVLAGGPGDLAAASGQSLEE
ncbi:MBL fold metallo-hydrolase [Haloechinothrix sp. YIM 98757]|uniref:MBL fold metallo-hydrolase n=1 Tax=Haloechinothrix aidingensis TaxID=2752311 RepID=A0A837ZW22_9PSEU|nr:MBL fold metallo-hydrolase [Haloechinothrix aidingensis]